MLENLRGIWKHYQKQNRQEKLLILLTASVFFPFPVTLVTLAVVCADALTHRRQRQELSHIPGVKWLWLSIIWVLIVAVTRANWPGAAVCPIVFMIGVAMVYARRYMTRPLFYTLVDLSCLLSFPCFLIAAVQRWTTPVVNELIDRPSATFLNANYYGCVAEMLILICIARLSDGVRQRRQILYYLTIAVNAMGLFFCNSFSAWFGIFAGCITLLVLHKRYYACFGVLFGFCAACALAFMLPFVFPRLNSLPQIFQIRTGIWNTALHGIYRHPLFGQGFLAFVSLSSVPGGIVQPHAHNFPLDMLLNFGFVGTPVILAYFIQMFATLRRRYLVTRRRGIYHIILALTVGWTVHGMTDVTLLWLQTGLLAMIFLGGYGAEEKRSLFLYR